MLRSCSFCCCCCCRPCSRCCAAATVADAAASFVAAATATGYVISLLLENKTKTALVLRRTLFSWEDLVRGVLDCCHLIEVVTYIQQAVQKLKTPTMRHCLVFTNVRTYYIFQFIKVKNKNKKIYKKKSPRCSKKKNMYTVIKRQVNNIDRHGGHCCESCK